MGDKHQAVSTREQTMSALQALILKAEGVFPEFATQPMSHNGCTRTIQRGALEIRVFNLQCLGEPLLAPSMRCLELGAAAETTTKDVPAVDLRTTNLFDLAGTFCDDVGVLVASVHALMQPSVQPQKVVVVMRGVPGSGKSTLVQQMVDGLPDGSAAVCSADHFFIDPTSGRYSFDFTQLPEAHDWCKERFTQALEIATPLVVLDNTCIRHWEYKPYENAALKAGYALVIVELRSIGTDHAELALALGSRNAHGVPIAKIEEMLGRWQEDPRACTVQIGGLAKAAESCTEMNPNSNMFMPSKGGQPNELQV